MSDSRYHIHLACVPDDVSIQTAQDDLSIFLEDRAFITRDLLVVGQESASYSRRCVNECDLVVFIIGQEYGQVNQSGVSQLHLTYTNAKTKQKPMLIFVSQDLTNTRNRHLADLINSIQNQQSHTISFGSHTGLKQVLTLAFDNLDLPAQKWNSYERERTAVDAKTAIEIVKNSVETLDIELFEGILSNHKIDLDLSATPSLISLDDEVSLDCTAHVFEGGTLIEVEFVFTLTWRRILQALEELKLPFSEQGLSRCLNELIDKHQVDEMIMVQHPKSHAISRHQIKKTELARVKAELQSAGWIVSPGSNMLWIVSDDIKQTQGRGVND
ncbi:DUF4062 domain-containing protein [Moraxella oblonga]|uniref:DUF4062 domain-containing protein n=1 Tax=Moraxella oblonga TaxID=200413 RepID=UPI0008324E9F|nr:DUF4062 domain-containing protein [Moraxella oblonga]